MRKYISRPRVVEQNETKNIYRKISDFYAISLFYFSPLEDKKNFSRIGELIIKICAILCINLFVILRGKFRGDFTKLYANFMKKM